MRSTALAAHDEKPPWPLSIFHFLKIETPLGQALQRIRGILYGFLTMFCCLPEEAPILERDPYSYATCRFGGLLSRAAGRCRGKKKERLRLAVRGGKGKRLKAENE